MGFESELSGFWNIWVIGLITINLVLLVWLIIWTQKIPAGEAQSENDTTGHAFDGIEELNNPLPKWWLYMLYITIVFAIGYLILYPGYGNVTGLLSHDKGQEIFNKAASLKPEFGHVKTSNGWSQEGQWAQEVAEYDAKVAPIFAKFSKQSVADLSKDANATRIGKRLFVNYCSVCHGTDAKGAKNFPNLTDKDWLYGGKPDVIKTTILNGRGGVMPPFGGVPLSDEDLDNVANYVLSLSDRKHDLAKAGKGKKNFAICSACHGATGQGTQVLGAPNLTDKVWLHGRSLYEIKRNIKVGFNGQKNRMPAFKEFLGEDKVRLLAAYVYSLSQP